MCVVVCVSLYVCHCMFAVVCVSVVCVSVVFVSLYVCLVQHVHAEVKLVKEICEGKGSLRDMPGKGRWRSPGRRWALGYRLAKSQSWQ